MRRVQVLKAVMAATLSLSMLSPAAAMPAGPGPGHFSSDNVTWISVNPRHSGSDGGRLVDGYFYVTDPRGVFIYDVANPAAPVLKGSVTIIQSEDRAALGQEDVDTNGEILIVDAINPDDGAAASYELLVIDVKDKTAPRVVGSVGTTDHTWTCVQDCSYAYGRTGEIVDLTNPAAPKVAANWKTSVSGSGYTHDFTEVAPNRLMSSGQPSFYLDTTNPLKPKKLSTVKTTFSSLGYHHNLWPRRAADSFLLMGTEIAPAGATNNFAGSDCQGDGEIATYDTAEIRAAEQYAAEHPDEAWGAGAATPPVFKKLGTWRIAPGRGVWTDGKAPGHVLYCEHWFDTHPEWNNGGLVVTGHYDSGTRFLSVDAAGAIKEVGWFAPVAGYTGSAFWVSKDIVYVLDYRRGLDILRFTPTP